MKQNVPLSHLSTLGTGGRARYLLDVESADQAFQALDWAASNNLRVLFVGDGSNVLFPDEGYPGLILTNRMEDIERQGLEVEAGGGLSLKRFIRWLNRNRLAGMEKLFGIPGTIAGAVVGNAGAYGQEICETISEVTVLASGKIRQLTPSELEFGYRHSLLKEDRTLFLVSCRFRFTRAKGNLQAVSESILQERLRKYPPELKCPGSFFKNVPRTHLPEEIFNRLPRDFEFFGKIPAGKLLEAVGAKGARRGGAEIALHHANLFLNRGDGRSADFVELADQYSQRVLERFGIRLEPEVLIVTPDSANIRPWNPERAQADHPGEQKRPKGPN